MDSIRYEALHKMFLNRRLHPFEPEHAIFIKAELARMEVLDPKDAKSYKDFYDQKMKEWEGTPDDPLPDMAVPSRALNQLPLPEHAPVEAPVEVEEDPIEEHVEAPVETVQKSKRGRKPKAL